MTYGYTINGYTINECENECENNEKINNSIIVIYLLFKFLNF